MDDSGAIGIIVSLNRYYCIAFSSNTLALLPDGMLSWF